MPQATQPQPWYAIRKRSPQASAAMGVQAPAEILIYGDIGESWWEETVSARQFVKDIAAIDAQAITIRINSNGGSVPDGIAIYNAIKRHPATVTTVVDGMALSIASLIAMAGDTVEIAENGVFMVHAPWVMWASGNAIQLRELADQLDVWSAAVCTSMVSKTGKPEAEMLALLTDGKDHWYTAAQAVEMGFADAVISAAPVAAHASAMLASARFNPENMPAAVRACLYPAAAAALPPVAQATPTQEPSMPQSVNPQAAAPQQPAAPAQAATNDAAAIRAQALADDAQRRSGIRAAFAPFMSHPGMSELATQLENDHNTTVQAANQKILAKLGESAAPIAGGRLYTAEDETDKRRTAMVSAMLMRAGVPVAKEHQNAGANPYRGRTLLAMAEASLQAQGINTNQYGDSRKLVAAAFTQSTGDFPILLENVLHKTLLSAYNLKPFTWKRFCKTGSVGDFRAHNRYRRGTFGNLQGKTETGEFQFGHMGDAEKASITAGTKGLIIGISREMVINDDLSAITDQASDLGLSAARTVEDDVYAALLSNNGMGPTMSDGKPMIHADHGNIATGAMSVVAFDAIRSLMGRQKDVGGKNFTDLRPDVLLCPLELQGTAKVINDAQFDPSATNSSVPNRSRNMIRDIVDTPRLSGAPYWVFAPAMESPALEVAFLDGNSEPYLEMKDIFTGDGMQWKAVLDYGVAGIDWRGVVRCTGAAAT
jgi:ATP-dependent protease ClpP protease subunit